MSTVTVPRSNVTADEVCSILGRILGPRYTVTRDTVGADAGTSRGGDTTTISIRSGWFARANVRVVPVAHGTEIHVAPGAAYGLIGIIVGSGLVRRVSTALNGAPELAMSEKGPATD